MLEKKKCRNIKKRGVGKKEVQECMEERCSKKEEGRSI